MVRLETLPQEIKPAYEKLREILRSYDSLVVAYSGGLDSGFLSFAARDALEDRMISVLGLSNSLAKSEEEGAMEFLRQNRIPYACIETNELEMAEYRANSPDRCYYCKDELFAKLEKFAEEKGYSRIAHGASVDDQSDYRPGTRAAHERNIVAPLVEAGFTKAMIRRAAEALGLSIWNKPAAPCLASRVPYYTPVTSEKLMQIEEAERALKEMGFTTCRVRHHGDVARIEVPWEDRVRLFEKEIWRTVAERVKRAGFQYVAVDLEGFRSGSLNEQLERQS